METKTLTFKVARKAPEMIAPAKATPHEFKPLSDIDDQEDLRCLALMIFFYRRSPSMEGKDPAKVIRDALARALVFYYPLAGRLREHAAKKLVVECTGEGVMFVEADADVALHQFGDPIQPPFPCVEELLYDVPAASTGPLDSPLMFIQVTRLKCGGFILAIFLSHNMCDAAGQVQFLSAVGELAGGADAPSISPVWDRHLLNARNPPRVTFTHPEYDDDDDLALLPLDDTVLHSFFFGDAEFAALQRHLPPHLLRSFSRFDLLAACLWRCRTIALSPEDNEEVRLMFMVDYRRRLNPPLPVGYYGNAIASPVAVATAGDLSKNPLCYALEVLRKTKADVTEEWVRSLADLLVIGGRCIPRLAYGRSYGVSDLTRVGFQLVDFGWGKSVYSGPPNSCTPPPTAMSFLFPFKNNKGENGVVVPIRLPPKQMEVFAEELERMLRGGGGDLVKVSKL